MLDSPIHRESLMKFIEDALVIEEAEDIEYIQDFDVDGETMTLWLVSMVDGEEYWIIEGDQPCAFYKNSGIYNKAERVIELYETMKDASEQEDVKDRFSYGYE